MFVKNLTGNVLKYEKGEVKVILPPFRVVFINDLTVSKEKLKKTFRKDIEIIGYDKKEAEQVIPAKEVVDEVKIEVKEDLAVEEVVEKPKRPRKRKK